MGTVSQSKAQATTADELSGQRSCNELLNLYDQMGIPHFQRGLVWDSRAVGLLLESLYFGTPCGSIIVWAPPDADRQGVPLGKAGLRILIVDGQQRIRSLHSVFAAGSDNDPGCDALGDDASDGDDVAGRGEAAWCLNLGRVPEFAEEFKGGKRYPLFRLVRDPWLSAHGDGPQKRSGVHIHDQEALLPLAWFIENRNSVTRLVDEPNNHAIAKAVKAVLSNVEVSHRLWRMPEQRVFAVAALAPECSHREVVATFNRINSSGKRVEAEERAFANLVAASDHAEDALRTFFQRTAHPLGLGLTRDDFLQRQKESRFGFKLFMRAFMMALAYHSGRALGSATLSFDAADQDSLEEARAQLESILDETVALLVEVKLILRGKLYCDDFRMLPETASLWPIFQFLIRFPKYVPAGRDALAAITLRLLLAKLDKRQLLDLCSRVGTARSPKEALAAFDCKVLRSEAVAKAIAHGVDESQSLTDRYALLLYWLLRRRNALDFSYDINAPTSAGSLRKRYASALEPLLSEVVEPQKQHIVPYKRLKAVFKLSGARPGKHLTHDIGNLTYISAGLNDFKTGIGEHPLKLSAEPLLNRKAHLLDDAKMLAHFEAVLQATDGHAEDVSNARRDYGRFCRRRRDKISSAFVEWEKALRGGVDATDAAQADDALVAMRRVKPQLDDRVRGLPYDPQIHQRLTALCLKGMKRVRIKSADFALKPKRKPGEPQTVRIDLFVDGRKLRVKLHDDRLMNRFRHRFGDVSVHERRGSVLCNIPTISHAEIVRASEILDWIDGVFGRRA